MIIEEEGGIRNKKERIQNFKFDDLKKDATEKVQKLLKNLIIDEIYLELLGKPAVKISNQAELKLAKQDFKTQNPENKPLYFIIKTKPRDF